MGGPGYEAAEGAAWFDANVVDGAVEGTAVAVRDAAGELRKSQSGFVRAYAALIGVGVVVLLAWFVIARASCDGDLGAVSPSNDLGAISASTCRKRRPVRRARGLA